MSFHFPRTSAATSGEPIHALVEHSAVTVSSLLPGLDSADIAFGEISIPINGEIPVHRNRHPETIYLLEGTLRVWRPGGSVEVSAPSAVYFPAEEAHAIRNIGSTPATLLAAWATGGEDKELSSVLEGESALSSPRSPSLMPFQGPVVARWAVSAEMPNWEPVEPSKGMSLRVKYLLDGASGTRDFVVGLASVAPNLHYTIHRHEPAEIYYVLSGTATIYVGDEGYAVAPGDTVYVPAWAPHGIDTADEPLEMYWFYATDQCDSWAWEPLEPIYSDPPRRRLEPGPRGGFAQ